MTAINIMQNLPNELKLRIFNFCDKPSLVSLAQVSHSTNFFVTRLIYSSVSFSSFPSFVSFCRAVANLPVLYTRSLYLHDPFTFIDNNEFAGLLDSLIPKLTMLESFDAENFNVFISSLVISRLSLVSRNFSTFKCSGLVFNKDAPPQSLNLKELTFKTYDSDCNATWFFSTCLLGSLETLSIPQLPPNILSTLLQSSKLSNLKNLKILDSAQSQSNDFKIMFSVFSPILHQLESLSLEDVALLNIGSLFTMCSNLETLVISLIEGDIGETDFSAIVNSLPKLKSLHANHTLIPKLDLELALQNKNSLVDLHLFDVGLEFDSRFFSLISNNCRNLVKLTLCDCDGDENVLVNSNGDDARMLLENCSNLSSVYLSGVSRQFREFLESSGVLDPSY